MWLCNCCVWLAPTGALCTHCDGVYSADQRTVLYPCGPEQVHDMYTGSLFHDCTWADGDDSCWVWADKDVLDLRKHKRCSNLCSGSGFCVQYVLLFIRTDLCALSVLSRYNKEAYHSLYNQRFCLILMLLVQCRVNSLHQCTADAFNLSQFLGSGHQMWLLVDFLFL